jgi:hypothetical protein
MKKVVFFAQKALEIQKNIPIYALSNKKGKGRSILLRYTTEISLRDKAFLMLSSRTLNRFI